MFSVFPTADSQRRKQIITILETQKKKRGSQNLAHPARLGLRIAHLSRINNADAHANGYTIKKYIRKHERQTLSYHAIDSEVAKFKRAADKTSVQRLS